ncbi:hypothetical protein Cgig2_001816 [Carnegiea gigantea]|uniref:Uncharacterized protein n=1 Tax=Carnegiea gigantea TaxID=171969 RepID=A0A9Q1GHW9_9CARY|nr:hypothetical protein Cgig2_001816 [Carnegiea gigantea]
MPPTHAQVSAVMGVRKGTQLRPNLKTPEHLNNRVCKEWKSTASKRLGDMVRKAMDKEITEWMPIEQKQRVQAIWQTDAFKKRSTQNKKNKTTGPKNEYERLKHNASQSGTQIDDDKLFLQTVGGKNKKGTVYGLGTESEAYFPGSAHHFSLVTTTYTPSVVSQMEARLKKIRRCSSSCKGGA